MSDDLVRISAEEVLRRVSDGPLMMTATPDSVEEAWRWIESLLSRQPHGRTYWDIEQNIQRARELCYWIRVQTDSLLPIERLFSGPADSERSDE